MKLYATVGSERAKKGQGGNKILCTELFTGSRDVSVLRLTMITKAHDDGTVTVGLHESQQDGSNKCVWATNYKNAVKSRTKGKKKKDECDHDIITDDYGKEYCQECGTYRNI